MGSVAAGREDKKVEKYSNLSDNYHFVPVSVETYDAYALSFYRSQNVLCWSKFFEPAQKFSDTLCQLQTFCARQKDDLHSVKLVFVPAQKFLKRH